MLEGMSTGVIMSGLLLGAIGFFMFMYGKREGQPLTLIAGIAVSILPMVMHSVLLLWVVSAVLIAGVVLHRRQAGTSTVA